MRLSLAGLSCACMLLACTAFKAGDAASVTEAGAPSSSDPAAGNDAGREIPPAAFDMADAGVFVADAAALSVNLVPPAESDFETGTLCGGAYAWHGEFSFTNPGHTGQRACRACRTSNGAYTFDTTDLVLKPPLGAKYHAEAWVRGNGVSQKIGIYLRLLIKEDSIDESPEDAKDAPDWTLVQSDLTVTQSVDRMDLVIDGTTKSPSPCFDVDDVRVVRVQ